MPHNWLHFGIYYQCVIARYERMKRLLVDWLWQRRRHLCLYSPWSIKQRSMSLRLPINHLLFSIFDKIIIERQLEKNTKCVFLWTPFTCYCCSKHSSEIGIVNIVIFHYHDLIELGAFSCTEIWMFHLEQTSACHTTPFHLPKVVSRRWNFNESPISDEMGS